MPFSEVLTDINECYLMLQYACYYDDECIV